MPSSEVLLTEAFDCYRRGDFAAAEAISGRLLADFAGRPDDIRIDALAGMVALQQGRAADAVDHLRRAVSAAPDNLPLRSSLGFALVTADRLDEARQVASAGSAPQLWRIVALVDQRQGRSDEAITGYRRVLAEFPADYESWTNLGQLFLAEGQTDKAIEAFRGALAAQPNQPELLINLSRALASGQRFAERQALMQQAVQEFPDNPALLVQLGLAEGAVNDAASAEAAYRRALLLDPDSPRVYLEYGMFLEKLNRVDEMAALVAQARARGLTGGLIDFVEAWSLKRGGCFAEALALVEATDGEVDAAWRAQLIGELSDRMEMPDRAFEAFLEMNKSSASRPASHDAQRRNFPGEVAATIAKLTPDRVARWTPLTIRESPAAPVFIIGFPRSGTTLLDTFLMNIPDVEVLEEIPVAEQVEIALGDPERIAGLTTREADRLRAGYFSILRELAPHTRTDCLIVDKFPLNMVRAALIHRVFPDARFVMVERHPCDVILSCFMARFQANPAMVQFQDLGAAARLYDLAFEAWTRAVALLPLRVHIVRYERMVSDLESELRKLLSFLGVAWQAGVLDNQGSAARRAHIATPSYGQVIEPIYGRAVGRWQSYRKHLEPILPILAPWAEKMGYSL